MLVTKREVKQTSKKLLSVLLAVIMLMSTMSVSFGTFTFNASAAGDADYNALARALESSTVTAAGNGNFGTMSTTGTGGNNTAVVNTTTLKTTTYAQYVELRDILTLMNNAIRGTDEFKNHKEADDDQSLRTCTNSKLIYEELKEKLELESLSITTPIDNFIKFFLEHSKITPHQDGDNNGNKTPNTYTNTVNVYTEDYKGYLATIGDYTKCDATITLGYTYSFKMGEGYYTTNKGDKCNEKKHYHTMVWEKSYPIDDPSTYTAANKTGVNTTLNNHAAAINAFTSVSYDDLIAKVSAGTIDTFLSDFEAAEKTAKTYVGGESIYNKLFGSFASAVANQKASIASAKALQEYLPIVENYKNFIAANPDYGRFSWGENGGANNWGIFGEKGSATHAKMEADYRTFKSYYDSIAAGGSILDYFVSNGDIDMQYYYAFTDNYNVYYLNDSRNAADAFYAQYKDTFKDYTTEEQVVLLSQVTGFIDAIPAYRSNVRGGELQVINAIYNEGYNYLRDMKEDLTVEVNEFVLYFAENAHKSFVDFNTKAVWAKLDEAIEKRSGLNAFYNTLSSARRDQLLGQLITDANHMVQGLYQLLGNRFTAEVDSAYAVYTVLGKPSTVTVETFLKLNAVLLAIETSIMTDLDGRNQGGYITSATRAKYDEMKVSIIPVCDAYRTTYGFNDYEQTFIADETTGIYPEDRGLYEDDEVKTQPYVVDKAKMNQLIAALDKIINSDVVGGLLGGLLGVAEGEEFNLGNALSDLIKGALFSDEFINTVVQLLYPLVVDEFNKVWVGLPLSTSISNIEVQVSYKDDLHGVLDYTGFWVYPDLMAKTLDSKYQDNIDMLLAAKKNWESPRIVDPETRKLKLTWGVAEQKEKLENGEITMAQFESFFYNAFEDATTGLYPLLAALIKNEPWAPPYMYNLAKANALGGLGSFNVHLQLGATGNRGYSNLLIPIYESLGLSTSEYKPVSTIESSDSIAEILRWILEPIFTFVEKLSTNPVEQILNILPNLIYSTAFNMIPALLDMLQTNVTYTADAKDGPFGLSVDGAIKGAAEIKVGSMIITDDEGALLPKSMFTGGLKSILENFGIVIPTIDQATLATLGKLVKHDTQREKYVYSGLEGTGKAYFIEADKADVGYYLLSYILGAVKDEQAFTNLLGGFITVKDENGEPIKDADGKTTPDYEAIAKLKETVYNDEGLNLDAIDVGDAIAAIVELANQIEYGVDPYYWYAGENNSPLGTTAAADIYLNPGNDWTEAKAQYLYENLEGLLNSIFSMAGLDISVEGALADALGGLFSNKTVTGLAKLLGSLSDLGALLAPKAEEDAPEASEPETVAEGEEAGLGIASILTDLLKNELGIDLSVYAQYANLADDAEIDFGVTDAASFVAALTELLTPLKPVLDFILGGKDLTLINSAITLHGYKGYDNAIIPLLEALGAAPAAYTENADTLALTLNALVGVINKLTTNDPEVEKDGAIYTIIDMLPGVIYYISSNALSQGIDKLLTPVYAILDTIRPIYNLDLGTLLAGIEVDFDKDGVKEPLDLDIKNINWSFIFGLLNDLLGLDLSALQQVIYDVCDDIETTYTSASKLNSTWKKGAYNDNFSQADMLTVVLSFLLDWATKEGNAAKLDELLKTNGLISSIGKVFEDVEITYGTPNWMYWFESEEAFNAYLAGNTNIPNTLASIDWAAIEGNNDWDYDTAQYFAENIDELVDLIIGMINEGKTDDEGNALPTTLSDLLSDLVNGLVNAETLNDLVGMITGLLSDIDENLINTAGYLLDVDLAGLKAYTCEAEIKTISDFINELANVLDKYAGGLVNWLFFGDDYRFAKKSDNTDTIVINGGLGYEKGLGMILEALGCELPAEANTKSVLGALATRVDAILANPVDEVIGLLPNLVYFLNANGAGVAANNLLAPVNALLNKINGLGLLEKNIVLADLLKFTTESGDEIVIDFENLALANVVEIVETLTDLPLDAAEAILVNFCTGKITKGTYIYKMEAAREDVITILLYVALELISDDAFAAKLDAMLGTDFIAGIKGIFEGSTIEYKDPNWNYMNGIENEGVIEYVNAITSYPNDWTEEKAEYLAENLPALVDTVIGMLEINGKKYESLKALLSELLADSNIFTTKTLEDLLGLIKNFLSGIDEELLKLGFILDVKLDKLVKYEVKKDIDTVEEFADELAYILGEFAPGVVEWLLLGRDFKLLVKDADGIEAGLEGTPYITINGAQGYAEGLALLLEALGCENLPAVYDAENLDTAATVEAVLTSLANRIDEILANPVEEILDLLPNLIYFLEADGVEAVIKNTTAALNALIAKLEVFDIKLDIMSLVDLPKLMGIADKYEDGEAKIGLDNLTITALLKALSLMTGLDLTELENVLVPFAIGEAVLVKDSVSKNNTYKMVYKNDLDKHDMLSVVVSAALRMFFAGTETSDKNAAKLDEMLKTDNIVAALKDVFADIAITYETPDWNYPLAENGTVDAMKYSITYPNNWTEETAQYVTEVLLSKEFDALISGLIEDGKYKSLSDLLKAKVNVFTSDNLQSIVDLIANLLKDIDDGLLEAAGVLLGANVVGLKDYKVPAGITTVDAFAAELANVLNTYAKGVVEWLLLGNDYRFFVKEVKDGAPVDFIVINGAKGYANGLALLLEALGCKNLPATGTTEEIVAGVLNSLAARINDILADPVNEIVALLPNLFYFLNANGVAAAVKNTTAALTALSVKLEKLGLAINLDVSKMVDLKELLKLPAEAALSMENLSMAAVLEAVGIMAGLDLTVIKDVLVGFGLGKVESYKSVSGDEKAKKMVYADEFDKYDLVTVVANLALLTIKDSDNAEFLKNLVGEEIYQLIYNLFSIAEVPVQDFSWQYTDKADSGYVFSALNTSEKYKSFEYGPNYTKEMAQYIADNFGEFVDNVIYLFGLQINGKNVKNLKDIINGLLDGNLYTRDNVVAIRDALAGVLSGIADLEVKGQNVGKYIVEVLKKAEIADIAAVAKVEIGEINNKNDFVEALCDVVEPFYPVLRWVLANDDISFFVDLNKKDLISLKGAEGYAYGIIPLLEALECEGILTPDAYYAAVEADADALLKEILKPLLNRVDAIIANPADEILAILPNIIYFVNSNGLDTVVKNTLNAVYALLNAIKPVAQIDVYELIGVDLATIDFNWLLEKVIELIAGSGYQLKAEDFNALAELTTGTLKSYTSLNGKTAYKMVYAMSEEGVALTADTVTVLLRAIITFILTENNREVIVDILKNELGMSADVEKYITALLNSFADVVVGKKGEDLRLGMDTVLATIYYIFYSLDVGVDNTVVGKDNLSKLWAAKIKELNDNSPSENTQVGNLITDIFDILFNDPDEEGNFPVGGGNDVADKEEIAPNGFIAFFQRIAKFFEEIGEFFRNLFSFGK